MRTFVARTTLVWLALRLLSATTGSPWSAPAVIIVGLGAVLVVLVDASVRDEQTFMANLGIGRRHTAAVALLTVASLEVLVGVVVAVAFTR